MNLGLMETTELGIMLGTIFSVIIIWWYSRKQLNELKNQIWVSVYSDYTRRYADIIAKFPEKINEKDFEIQRLETKEYNRVMRAMRLYFDLCYEEYCLYYNYKKIDENLWLDWKEGIEVALSKKAFEDAWAIIHKDTVFSDDFDRFIQNIINKNK